MVGHPGPEAAFQKAKEAARERLLTEQLAFTESFIERSRKRIEVLETKKAEEVALLEQAMQLQNRLRQEMLAQASPPVVGSGPESWSEVVALRARVAELEACARRPPRNSEDAAQNIRAKAAKRRLGTCSEDVVPSTDQQLSEWLDGMNCEFGDALDVGDMESAITLSGLISRGAAKRRVWFPLPLSPAWCREEGDIVGHARRPRRGGFPPRFSWFLTEDPGASPVSEPQCRSSGWWRGRFHAFDAFGRAIASHAFCVGSCSPTNRRG